MSPAEIMRRIRAVAEADTENFSHLLKISGLDPAKDFVGADLSGIDLRPMALDGFNLTGCLVSRGALPVNEVGACDALLVDVPFKEMLILRDPAKAERLAIEASQIAELGALDEAEQLFLKGIAADPKHAGCLSRFALFMHIKRGEMDYAQHLYRAAMDADSNNADNLGNFAVFMSTVRGDMDAAEQLYREAIAANSKHFRSLSNFAGFMQIVRGDMDAAELLYREAIAVVPKHADTLGSFALFMNAVRGDMDAAELLYRAAVAADPKHANNLGNFAYLLIQSGREAEAEGLVEQASEYADSTKQKSLILECWFYRYACFPAWREEALRQLIDLLDAGIRSPGFDLTGVAARGRVLGHPEADLLDALAAVIAGQAEAASLEVFAAWRRVELAPAD